MPTLHLQCSPGHQADPVQIAYRQIQQIGPNMSKGTKIGLIALAGVAVAITVVAVYIAENAH
jgi:hypothetical protein